MTDTVRFVQAGTTPSTAAAAANPQPAPKVRGDEVAGGRFKTKTKKQPPPAETVPLHMDKDWGSFQQHSSGYGLKLLKQMGFTGRLGKDAQGIVNPVVPKLRPRGMGIGFNNFNEQNTATVVRNLKQEQEALQAKQKEQERVAALKHAQDMAGGAREWRKTAAKPKKVYKTAADVAKQAQRSNVIIDMRGTRAKVTTLSDLGDTTMVGDDDDDDDDLLDVLGTTQGDQAMLPELQHNMRLLVDMLQGDIAQLSTSRSKLIDTAASLRKSQTHAEAVRAKDLQTMEELKRVQVVLGECKQAIEAPTTTAHAQLAILAQCLDTCFATSRGACVQLGVPLLIAQWAVARLKTLAREWTPLQKGVDLVAELEAWRRRLLGGSEDTGRRRHAPIFAEAYTLLTEKGVLPRLQLFFSSEWDPRGHAADMIQFIQRVRDVIPMHIFEPRVLDELIVPRLRHFVTSSNLRQDALPLHVSLIPWIPLLPSDAVAALLELVCSKYVGALHTWHPGDPSALVVLSPWGRVWTHPAMRPVLKRAIVPKLERVLEKEVDVVPSDQDMTPWLWVKPWHPLVDVTPLLIRHFFPKWFRALAAWLQQDGCDAEEVMLWYLGWKRELHFVLTTPTSDASPAELATAAASPAARAAARINHLFVKGLDLMNCAARGGDVRSLLRVVLLETQPSRGFGAEEAPLQRQKKKTASRRRGTDDEGMGSFRDGVAEYAALHGASFLPAKRRAAVDGKPVYAFGSCKVYLDHGTVYMQTRDEGATEWIPIGLPDLVLLARE